MSRDRGKAMAKTDAHCPQCSEILDDPNRCSECGWQKRGGTKQKHVEDMRCQFQVGGRRCYMPGTVSYDTSGSTDGKVQRHLYCAWHWQFVRGVDQRFVQDRAEFDQWRAKRLSLLQPWQRSLWQANADALWQRVMGHGTPRLETPTPPDIREIATSRGVKIEDRHQRQAHETVEAGYEPGTDEPVVWGEREAM